MENHIFMFYHHPTLALILGIGCAHLFEVGRGVDISIFQASMQSYQAPDSLNPATFFTNFIQNTLINPFKAFSDGNVLAVVVFALFVGFALVQGGERFKSIRLLSHQFFEMMMMLVGWVMKLAPLGIFALLAKLMATEDISVLSRLAEFAVVVTGPLFFMVLLFCHYCLDCWSYESLDFFQRYTYSLNYCICNKF